MGGVCLVVKSPPRTRGDGIESFKRRIPTPSLPYRPYGMNAGTYGPSKEKGCLPIMVESLPRSSRAPGSLGGVQRFAKAHRLSLKQAQRVLERDLAYTLHKPRRRRFPTVPCDCWRVRRSMGGGFSRSPTVGQI